MLMARTTILALLPALLLTLPTGPVAAQEEGVAAADTAAPPRGNCASCHRDLEQERFATPAREFFESVHGAAGLDCVACHGGDATAVREEVAHQGSMTRPSRTRIPFLCARCHSNARYMKQFSPDIRVDQLARYRTSVHGQRLLNLRDTLVATCVDCHTAHSIRPPGDEASKVHHSRIPETCGECHADEEYMEPYPIPTDQLADYRKSVHWRAIEEGDPSAPVCNDCHGNHGAAPPEVEWVGEVCSDCHSRIGSYFASSVHDSVFAYLGEPGCATCHGNHAIREAGEEMLGVEGEAAVCGGGGCHTPSDEGGETAVAMAQAIDSLRESYDRADSILTVAERAGMHVSEAQFELNRTQNSLLKARASIHIARTDSVRAAVEEGLEVTRSGYQAGREALDELRFRRLGLAVSSVIVLVLIGALVTKIRHLES